MSRIQEFLEAAREGDLSTLSRLLEAEPELVNARNEQGQSPVLAAAYAGKREAVHFLLARGAETDIYEACAIGELERVKAEAAEDPDRVNSWSEDGFTPLQLACFFGHTPIVGFLISAGANVRAASKNLMRVTPLHSAAASNHVEAVRLLIAGGADVGAVQQGGYTALHSAASNGNEEIARLLLAAGADPAARSDDGRSPIELAAARGHSAVAALLGPAQGASAGL